MDGERIALVERRTNYSKIHHRFKGGGRVPELLHIGATRYLLENSRKSDTMELRAGSLLVLGAFARAGVFLFAGKGWADA